MATPIASSVLGVAGFDTKAAVAGLLAFDKLEISNVQKKQTAETAKQAAFSAINAAMLSFKNTALSMADSTRFFAYTAGLTSSSSAVAAGSLLDVTGTNAVSAGKHSIIVQQVAQAQRLSSGTAVLDSTGTVANSDQTALGLSGNFTLAGTSIAINATDSLQNIAATINQHNASTGVSASIIKVANNDFRLILASDATGATGFTLSGTSLDVGGTLAGLNLGATAQGNAQSVLQTPKDATVNIDGLSLSRSSNSISDALQGVTLNLKQADPTVTVTMDISVDTVALQNNVQAFVDAYNGVQGLINAQFTLDPKTGTTGVLASESILTTIQSTLSNSLLQSVTGLASDRNSMVLIGVEPDAQGVLTINPTLFDKFITTDLTAIRDVFVANGSTSNTQVQFLTNGINTPSGTYQINVSQAATRASVASTGITDLVTNGLISADTVTIINLASQRQAVISLGLGQKQNAIISALNAEFSSVNTEVHQLSNSLGAGITSATLLSSLNAGILAGDTMTITGTNRQGSAINGSFSVLDPTIDTVGTLLSSIQSAFNQQVVASVDTASGKIQISDVQSGDSLLSINLSTGLGTLNVGTDTVTTEGRYAMNLAAVAQGNGISIQGSNFGPGSSFSIAQSFNRLGIVDQTTTGQSIIGTINGALATGSGQLLLGNAGITDGLGVMYTGSATGNVANMTMSVGLGAKLEGILNLFSNPFTGLIQTSISSSQSTFDTLTTRIADLERQMAQKKVSLQKSFTSMQQSLSTLNQAGSFLTQLNGVQNAPRA